MEPAPSAPAPEWPREDLAKFIFGGGLKPVIEFTVSDRKVYSSAPDAAFADTDRSLLVTGEKASSNTLIICKNETKLGGTIDLC